MMSLILYGYRMMVASLDTGIHLRYNSTYIIMLQCDSSMYVHFIVIKLLIHGTLLTVWLLRIQVLSKVTWLPLSLQSVLAANINPSKT